MNKAELNDKMLEQVSGGTFTSNRFSADIYRSVGVNVEKNFLAPDVFTLENGEQITYKEANALVLAQYGDEESARLAYSNSHPHHGR